MKTCEWCENIADELKDYQGSKICNNCYNAVTKYKCRKCGASIAPSDDESFKGFKGLCLSCLQLEEIKRAKQREDVKLGVELDSAMYADTEFTEKDYDEWMIYDPDSKGYKPSDFKNDAFLRRLWIMTKLSAVGIMDEKTINDNLADIEELISANFTKLLHNKCRFYIINKMADRKATEGMQCIAHKGKVWICKI